MGIFNKVRTLGVGFAFERAFERIVPAWMLRFCSLAVYQLDIEALSGKTSPANIKICESDLELDQLGEVTFNPGGKHTGIGLMAKLDDQVVGGLWIALGDYKDHDLGLSVLLGSDGAWVYAARVDDAYRRRGIYSHPMAQSALTRISNGSPPPLIGVSSLNKGSHKAIQRVGTPMGKILMIRLGSMVWARSSGRLQQNQAFALQCTRRPIQVSVPPPM